ncbi:MAG: NAD(P)-binding domain-containing protein [Mycobacterium sp.]
MSTISIIGAGEMAAAIARLAIGAGHAVELASRDTAKARRLAEQLGARASTGVFGAAPAGDLVILAVPYASAQDVLAEYGDALSGRVLVDITNPIKADFSGFLTAGDTFGAAEIARAARSATTVVKAFNTQFSHVLAAGALAGTTLDVFVAGDDVAAKTRVASFIGSLGLRAWDVGPLRVAQTLEHVCMLTLGLMTHAIKHTQFAIGVTVAG